MRSSGGHQPPPCNGRRVNSSTAGEVISPPPVPLQRERRHPTSALWLALEWGLVSVGAILSGWRSCAAPDATAVALFKHTQAARARTETRANSIAAPARPLGLDYGRAADDIQEQAAAALRCNCRCAFRRGRFFNDKPGHYAPPWATSVSAFSAFNLGPNSAGGQVGGSSFGATLPSHWDADRHQSATESPRQTEAADDIGPPEGSRAPSAPNWNALFLGLAGTNRWRGGSSRSAPLKGDSDGATSHRSEPRTTSARFAPGRRLSCCCCHCGERKLERCGGAS